MLSAKHRLLLYKIRVYGGERLSLFLDIPLYLLHIPAIRKTATRKTIVFVGEHLPPRIGRMAKWIGRESDYQCVLVCHRRGFIPGFVNDGLHGTYLFRNKWHLFRILRGISDIRIVHSFAPKSAYGNYARKFTGKPFVQDMQDVYSIYYRNKVLPKWLQRELPHEQECIAQAGGILAASLEVNQVLKAQRRQKRPRTLFFPLYCDEDALQPVRSGYPEEIHLVYVGGIAGNFRDPKHYGNIQFHTLIRLLTAQKLHFHIYPSPSVNDVDIREYREIARTNHRFHIHEPVSQQELAGELKKYHFGIHLGFVNHELHEQDRIKYTYCTTLKLFNFLEAGLPVICSANLVFQSWILERADAGIILQAAEELNDIGARLYGTDYAALTKGLSQGREKLLLGANVPRLIAFYNTLTHEE